MEKYVISGGPHTGKTSLMRALKERFPAFNYTQEPATAVLEEQQLHDGLYWRDVFSSPLQFCTACMWKSLELERQIDTSKQISFQDRSLIDTIAYSRRDGCTELVPIVKTLAKRATYNTVLFCEPVGEINNRIESIEEARSTHALLRDAYEEMQVPIILVPDMALNTRVDYIASALRLG